MSTFCLQHPWMTFWAVVLLLMVVDSMWENWCNRDRPHCNCGAGE